MKESKTSATAIVTMTVKVHLTQPWGGDATLESVQKTARRDAEEHLRMCATEMLKHSIRIGEIQSIRIILNEEKIEGS